MELKRTVNNIPNLIKRFKELGKSKIEIGYWATQGLHNSGMLYPTLMAIHEFGAPSVGIPSRPVLTDTFSIWSPLDKNMMLKKQLKLYFSNIKSKTPKMSATLMMERVSGNYVDIVRSNFGDSGKLVANAPLTQALKSAAGADPSKPLIWTGDLRDNLSYSINGQTIVTP